jgi:SAM-dependent methyltransferase
MVATVDTVELEAKVKEMYRHVAQEPGGDYHFELGERLALRVGYDADRLRNVPAGAVESFAGVGFFFDLASLTSGETVVDLGSASGMDALYAADCVGSSGRVVGIDFTLEQLEKARKLAAGAGADQVEFIEGRIESLPLGDASVDCVISNGVINLARQERRVRRSVAGAAPGWTPGDRRHHHREAADRGDRLQRRPVGIVHRRRRGAGSLSSGDRVGRLHHRDVAGQRLRVPLRPGPQRQREVWRQEHLAPRHQVGALSRQLA